MSQGNLYSYVKFMDELADTERRDIGAQEA